MLVAGAAEALFVVAPEIAPAPVEDAREGPVPCAGVRSRRRRRTTYRGCRYSLSIEVEAVPVVGLLAGALLVELVAMPSIVAPRPALPADAAPPPDDPPPEPGGETAVTVGALVKVSPEVTVVDEPFPVLVKVAPEVAADAFETEAELLEVDSQPKSFGKVTAPLPTWPCPPLPGIGPPTAWVASGLTPPARRPEKSARRAACQGAKQQGAPSCSGNARAARGFPIAGCGDAPLLRSRRGKPGRAWS